VKKKRDTSTIPRESAWILVGLLAAAAWAAVYGLWKLYGG